MSGHELPGCLPESACATCISELVRLKRIETAAERERDEQAEEIADVRRQLRAERIDHEHAQLNRAAASAQAEGMAKALRATTAMVRGLTADRDRWRAIAGRLADELTETQWLVYDYDDVSDLVCPACAWGQAEGHAAGECSIAAVLAEYAQATGEACR